MRVPRLLSCPPPPKIILLFGGGYCGLVKPTGGLDKPI